MFSDAHEIQAVLSFYNMHCNEIQSLITIHFSNKTNFLRNFQFFYFYEWDKNLARKIDFKINTKIIWNSFFYLLISQMHLVLGDFVHSSSQMFNILGSDTSNRDTTISSQVNVEILCHLVDLFWFQSSVSKHS